MAKETIASWHKDGTERTRITYSQTTGDRGPGIHNSSRLKGSPDNKLLTGHESGFGIRNRVLRWGILCTGPGEKRCLTSLRRVRRIQAVIRDLQEIQPFVGQNANDVRTSGSAVFRCRQTPASTAASMIDKMCTVQPFCSSCSTPSTAEPSHVCMHRQHDSAADLLVTISVLTAVTPLFRTRTSGKSEESSRCAMSACFETGPLLLEDVSACTNGLEYKQRSSFEQCMTTCLLSDCGRSLDFMTPDSERLNLALFASTSNYHDAGERHERSSVGGNTDDRDARRRRALQKTGPDMR